MKRDDMYLEVAALPSFDKSSQTWVLIRYWIDKNDRTFVSVDDVEGYLPVDGFPQDSLVREAMTEYVRQVIATKQDPLRLVISEALLKAKRERSAARAAGNKARWSLHNTTPVRWDFEVDDSPVEDVRVLRLRRGPTGPWNTKWPPDYVVDYFNLVPDREPFAVAVEFKNVEHMKLATGIPKSGEGEEAWLALSAMMGGSSQTVRWYPDSVSPARGSVVIDAPMARELDLHRTLNATATYMLYDWLDERHW